MCARALGVAISIPQRLNRAGRASQDDIFDSQPLDKLQRGIDHANLLAQIPKADLSEFSAQHSRPALARMPHRAGHGKQGALARTIWTEKRPVFAGMDLEGDIAQDDWTIWDPNRNIVQP